MDSIAETKAAFERGDLSREQFWLEMQQFHLGLQSYRNLVAGSEVAAIEIVAEAVHVVTHQGVKLVWDPYDLRTAPNVLVNTGTYEPIESAAMMHGAVGAKVIFDIGANIGYYSLHWSKVIRAGGSVHAFEPVPSTYQRLVRNIDLNDAAQLVCANNFGLGDAKRKVTFYVPSFSGSGAASLKDLHPEEQSTKVEAEIDTLDNYFRASGLDSLDMVKVDVEGAELMVIKGGIETISTHKPLLLMELLRKWSKPFGYHPNDVIAILRGMGYGCYSHFGSDLRRISEITDETLQTNFFFAHPQQHEDWLSLNGAVLSS